MDEIQCAICHKVLSFGKIEYSDFLDDAVCKKCDKLFDLQEGHLNFDEIILSGMRFDFVRNSFSENVKIKKIGSWRIGV
jgi:hypothetical protein